MINMLKQKNKLLNNVKNFYEGREKTIEGFKNEIFPFYYDEEYEEQMKVEREIKEEEEGKRKKQKTKNKKNKKKNQNKNQKKKNFSNIENKSKSISYDLFRKYFNFETPTQLTKKLFEIKDKKKNNDFVEESKSRWSKLKDEIEEIFEDTKKIEKPDKILKIVEEILNFNKQNQEGKGLKILTPNQMISRLPITLAQLKAGNNSEKLKNEIRQLLYSLYRSKNMTKQVYNNLIKYI